MHPLAARFTAFAAETDGSSPLYRRLSLAIAENDAILDLAARAMPGQLQPNMLFGAVQLLLAQDLAHPLAAFYPSLTAAPIDGDPSPAFAAFCAEHSAALGAIIAARRVQTNEVRRSGLLLPAFGLVSAEAGLPLALIEIGSSAGLNLRWDTYGYRYGERRVGAASAPVQLSVAPRSPVPLPDTMPAVDWRVGVDLAPVDTADGAAVAWLRALIWPEHAERFALLDAAIAELRRDPPRIIAGDALALLPGLLAEAPAGAARCVYDTFTVNQLTPGGRAELERQIAAASLDAPVWRIHLGWESGAAPELSLTRYAAGAQHRRALARCDPHGAWIAWRDLAT